MNPRITGQSSERGMIAEAQISKRQPSDDPGDRLRHPIIDERDRSTSFGDSAGEDGGDRFLPISRRSYRVTWLRTGLLVIEGGLPLLDEGAHALGLLVGFEGVGKGLEFGRETGRDLAIEGELHQSL